MKNLYLLDIDGVLADFADNFCNYEAPLRKEVEILKMNVADSFKVIDFLKRFYGRTR